MVNDEMLNKINGIMESNDMVFFRGQLRNIERGHNNDNSTYYLADIRVPRSSGDDVYGVSFNIFHICFPSDFVKCSQLTDEKMALYKNNEVLISVNLSCSVKTFKNNDNTVNKINNVRFFVQDILLLNNVQKPSFSSNKVAI